MEIARANCYRLREMLDRPCRQQRCDVQQPARYWPRVGGCRRSLLLARADDPLLRGRRLDADQQHRLHLIADRNGLLLDPELQLPALSEVQVEAPGGRHPSSCLMAIDLNQACQALGEKHQKACSTADAPGPSAPGASAWP